MTTKTKVFYCAAIALLISAILIDRYWDRSWKKGYEAGYKAMQAEIDAAIELDKKLKPEREAEAAKAETITITKYVNTDRVITVKGDTIIKEVPVYVTPESDSACTVPYGFASVYDRSILASEDDDQDTTRNADSASTAAADPVQVPEWAQESSGVPLSEVARVAAINARAYHKLNARYEALVEWSKTQCEKPS